MHQSRPSRTPVTVPAFVVAYSLVGLFATPSRVRAQGAPASFTSDQLLAGRGAFQEHCARCHMDDLSGRDDAPPLRGAYFASGWGGQPVTKLIAFVERFMPMDDPGSLDAEVSLNAVAYVLSRNGVAAGDVALVREAEGAIAVDVPERVR